VTPPADARRFEALYRAHHGAVVRFARRRVDPASAEEVVADTFAIAWRRLADVPDEPLPWLYAVALRCVLNARRAQASGRAKAASAAAVAATGARDPADVLAERDAVLRAFARLSEDDREALRLVAWEGLDQRAAAAVLGVTRPAFAMRLTRARRRLAAALDDQERPVPLARLQEDRP
jgi:RNA polymerase sigma factor (sigma-70 family)